MDRLFVYDLDSLVCRAGVNNLEARITQCINQCQADQYFVFDDQNFAHGILPPILTKPWSRATFRL